MTPALSGVTLGRPSGPPFLVALSMSNGVGLGVSDFIDSSASVPARSVCPRGLRVYFAPSYAVVTTLPPAVWRSSCTRLLARFSSSSTRKQLMV